MYFSLLAASLTFAGSVAAKQCQNLTVPVCISARNGVFNLPTLQGNADATTFAQNLTSIRGNFTKEVLLDYATVSGTYNISAKFCKPDVENGTNPTVQVLTHGLGFDKTYWDLPFNDFNYSYIDVAVDQYGFCTLSIDRLGEGNSSKADPLSVLQAPAEMSVLYELTSMLRNGTLPNVPHAFSKIVHVGHSFGSALSYLLAVMHPTASDGLILTGFSQNGSYLAATVASWDSKLARLNQPLRFGNISYAAVSGAISMLGSSSSSNTSQIASSLAKYNISLGELQQLFQTTDLGDLIAGAQPSDSPHQADLPSGYLTWTDAGSNQFAFLLPEFFDPSILQFAESTKFPYTLGELLTIGSGPPMAPEFKGPVQIVTGRQDSIYCGGDCLATGDPALASIPAKSKVAFPAAKAFEAYIQPDTAHGINLHYNSTAVYNVIQRFLNSQGLAPS
ncbi:MAG: hypothetical protein LQ350_001367 [Teloschistes chrysophthalmus]|nr:MAG: hypothetical protein LQ350_001367 [Niorma chrysophthalma]